MLIDEPKVRELLTRIVIIMDGNFHSREDLMQEALVHLWLEERQHPGHRLSWYLQGVRFHLHHYMVRGRSLDSPKHRKAWTACPDNCDGQDEWPDTLESDEGIMSQVNAHDLLSSLSDRLEPIERTILEALAEGWRTSEIAIDLRISHQSVLRRRHRISIIATNLGVLPTRTESYRSH